jgi:hypothetical protein
MSNMRRWRNLACATPGAKHVQNQIVCQDATDTLIVGNALIGVVCDGAGSAQFAHVGAKLVAETTAIALSKEIQNLQVVRIFGFFKLQASARTLLKAFRRVLQLNVRALERKAREMGCQPKDLATTLIAYIATPSWVGLMQVGDGFIVFRRSDEEEYELAFPPEKGEYANTTTFVTSSDAIQKMQVGIVTESVDFVCASSDGLERIALQWGSPVRAFPGFFKGVEGMLRADKYKLEEWMRSDPKLKAKTDDDLSIVAGVR